VTNAAEIRALQAMADKRKLPRPTKYLDSGSEGVVFETEDPSVVCRVGTRERVFDLMEWQHTGAVVRVDFLEKVKDDDLGNIVLSWQERVDPNVEGFVYRMRLSKDDETRLLSALSGLYDGAQLRRKIKVLREFAETENLAEAIDEGMPTGDLDLSSNLGVTSDGRIVAFDL
jgi:hypothetical protein